jgi:hypothetical protein
MEFIMVVIICFSMDCNAIWEQTRYPTMDDCLKASSNVKSFMMNKYPESAGEIYCMTEPQFNEYYDYLENGGKPTLESLPNPSAT